MKSATVEIETLTPFSKFPEHKKSVDVLNGFQHRAKELEEQKAILIAAMSECSQENHDATVLSRASEITAGGAEDFESRIESLRSGIAPINRDLVTLYEASKLQQKIVYGLEGKISKELCAERAPRHRELARRIIFGLLELIKANRAHRAFLSELESSGIQVSGHLQDMQIYRVGDEEEIRTMNGFAGNYIADAVRLGFVTNSEVEKAIRTE